MTMLGMQTDMQCHYFPSYFSTRDVNLNGGCSVWPSSANAVMNGQYYCESLAPPFIDPYMQYKDKFKHIMLQHEAIFKSQVHELHRLYNKQRDLMVDMKSVKFCEHKKKASIACAIPWMNPGSSIVQTQSNSKDREMLESNCKKIGKKILDLELPAFEYIDSDTEESFANETIPSEIPSYPMKSSVDNVICFADLNEPFRLEEEVDNEYNGKHIKGIDLNAISRCYSPDVVAKSSKELDFDCNSMPNSEEQLDNIDLESVTRPKFHVDLNSCINGDKFSPEVEFRPPESPENTEQSPHKVDSGENLSMPESKKLEGDLAIRAAEAIVSISSCEVQKDGSLYWFAKLAASVGDDAKAEFGMVLSCKKQDRGSEIEMDYFEAMTLQLEETVVQDYCFQPTSIRNEATCPALPSRVRARRGRQQRKDFQSEILPSLATLSRYEVNEDLQEIGGLIKAAESSRRTGRNGGTRARRGRPSKAETPMCLPLNRQIVEQNLLDWGKITRGRRGQRLPASNSRFILAKCS